MMCGESDSGDSVSGENVEGILCCISVVVLQRQQQLPLDMHACERREEEGGRRR